MAEKTPDENHEQQLGQKKLRRIAGRQKPVLSCILAYVVCVAGLFLTPPYMVSVLALAGLGVAVVAAFYVYALAIILYGKRVALLLAALTPIPVIGVISMLVVNSKASSTLRRHGLEVGVTGADMSEL